MSLQQSVTDLIEGSGALTEAYEADAENFYVDIHQSAEKVKKEVDKTAREGIEAYFSDVLDNEVNAMSTDPELRALGSSIGVVTHQHMRSINGLWVEMSGEPLKTRVWPLLAQARASKFRGGFCSCGDCFPATEGATGASGIPWCQPHSQGAYRVRRGT